MTHSAQSCPWREKVSYFNYCFASGFAFKPRESSMVSSGGLLEGPDVPFMLLLDISLSLKATPQSSSVLCPK